MTKPSKNSIWLFTIVSKVKFLCGWILCSSEIIVWGYIAVTKTRLGRFNAWEHLLIRFSVKVINQSLVICILSVVTDTNPPPSIFSPISNSGSAFEPARLDKSSLPRRCSFYSQRQSYQRSDDLRVMREPRPLVSFLITLDIKATNYMFFFISITFISILRLRFSKN